MRKQYDREWKVIQKSITITFFFYWVALLILSVYTLITRDELGPPFIIMNAGTVIFFSSILILKAGIKKEAKLRERADVMFYIFVGISIILVIVVLWSVDKFAGSSEMMSSFSNSAYKKLMVGLSIAAVLSLGYGIYAKITYQPPFLDISVNGESYTVFGDIGEVGYYADSLVTEGKETNLRLVLWEKLNLTEETEIMISDPSGKEVSWKPEVSIIEDVKIDEINKIYKLSPYTFEESGNVELTIRDKELSFTIDVKEQE